MKVREYNEKLKQLHKRHQIESIIMVVLLFISGYMIYTNVFPENIILRIIAALVIVSGIIVIIILFQQRCDAHEKERKYITITISRIEHSSGFGTYGISEKVYDFLLDYNMDEIHFCNHFVEDAISKAIDDYRKKYPLEDRPSAYQPDGINVIEYR